MLLLLISFLGGQAQDQEEMLLGKISVSELREGIYSDWFVANYEDYKVKEDANLKDQLEAVDVMIFMGTWCEDSQREVPRFYKIMDAQEFPQEKMELVAVNREKKTPRNLQRDLDIIRVPTMIFYRNGNELGRIVEYPITSLEEDMAKILSGEEYEHAYAN